MPVGQAAKRHRVKAQPGLRSKHPRNWRCAQQAGAESAQPPKGRFKAEREGDEGRRQAPRAAAPSSRLRPRRPSSSFHAALTAAAPRNPPCPGCGTTAVTRPGAAGQQREAPHPAAGLGPGHAAPRGIEDRSAGPCLRASPPPAASAAHHEHGLGDAERAPLAARRRLSAARGAAAGRRHLGEPTPRARPAPRRCTRADVSTYRRHGSGGRRGQGRARARERERERRVLRERHHTERERPRGRRHRARGGSRVVRHHSARVDGARLGVKSNRPATCHRDPPQH